MPAWTIASNKALLLEELKKRNLDTSGSKLDLISRLNRYQLEQEEANKQNSDKTVSSDKIVKNTSTSNGNAVQGQNVSPTSGLSFKTDKLKSILKSSKLSPNSTVKSVAKPKPEARPSNVSNSGDLKSPLDATVLIKDKPKESEEIANAFSETVKNTKATTSKAANVCAATDTATKQSLNNKVSKSVLSKNLSTTGALKSPQKVPAKTLTSFPTNSASKTLSTSKSPVGILKKTQPAILRGSENQRLSNFQTEVKKASLPRKLPTAAEFKEAKIVFQRLRKIIIYSVEYENIFNEPYKSAIESSISFHISCEKKENGELSTYINLSYEKIEDVTTNIEALKNGAPGIKFLDTSIPTTQFQSIMHSNVQRFKNFRSLIADNVLYVTGFSNKATESDIKSLFPDSQAVILPRSEETHDKLGHAYVCFADRQKAVTALKQIHECPVVFENTQLAVCLLISDEIIKASLSKSNNKTSNLKKAGIARKTPIASLSIPPEKKFKANANKKAFTSTPVALSNKRFSTVKPISTQNLRLKSIKPNLRSATSSFGHQRSTSGAYRSVPAASGVANKRYNYGSSTPNLNQFRSSSTKFQQQERAEPPQSHQYKLPSHRQQDQPQRLNIQPMSLAPKSDYRPTEAFSSYADPSLNINKLRSPTSKYDPLSMVHTLSEAGRQRETTMSAIDGRVYNSIDPQRNLRNPYSVQADTQKTVEIIGGLTSLLRSSASGLSQNTEKRSHGFSLNTDPYTRTNYDTDYRSYPNYQRDQEFTSRHLPY